MTLGDDVITVRGLTVGYGDRAVLRDLDFTVRRGEVYVLMGPSGCGKTTVLRHLLGLALAVPGGSNDARSEGQEGGAEEEAGGFHRLSGCL